MIWAKEETLPRQEIENIQLTRLKSTLKRIYERYLLIVLRWTNRE